MNTVQEISKIDTGALKKFAQIARRQLREQVTSRLDRVLKADSVETREKESAIKELKRQIEATSRETVIDRVAYTWFNRFCALRFMDVNHYTNIGVVSPALGYTQPEVLAEAKQGHIDDALKGLIDERRVFDLLGGQIPSTDPQQEAFRLLIVAVCNYYNSIMPFLFEKIADYTELLMPDDLLSESSVLTEMRTTLTKEACRDVEVIGWLYQFYISEKKDEVFEDLKKNKKIATENIPAATQLFTPNWIVRYLVENTLGRLWMLNRPKSRLVERMEYYIHPETTEQHVLRVDKPEEIRICDPACGSAHMLVYAFDLLYAIYEEEGYEPTDIPRLILENNLFGIEIDERAAELAALALVMKAREKYRRFFNKPVQPQICVLRPLFFTEEELKGYRAALGPDLFTEKFLESFTSFDMCDVAGSLIRPSTSNLPRIRATIMENKIDQNLFLHNTHQKVLDLLTFSEFLSPRYHVIVANPPYMGSKGMNASLKAFAQRNYPDSKSDLFSMFVQRLMDLVVPDGLIGLMTPFTWMFLGSYEKLRGRILQTSTLTSLVRPEYHAFFESAYVPICAFTLLSRPMPGYKGTFIDLSKFYGADVQPVKAKQAIADHTCTWRHSASAENFQKLPGFPIAYWISDKIRNVFASYSPLSAIGKARQGLATGDNNRFLRYWYEISTATLGLELSDARTALESGKRWFPCNKGGPYRKWFGNNEYVVNWYNDGEEIRGFVDENGKLRSRPQNREFYFKTGLTWSSLSSSALSMRYSPAGAISETKGSMFFCDDEPTLKYVLGFANTKLVETLLSAICPTLDFHEGPISTLPLNGNRDFAVLADIERAIDIAKVDWNSMETSTGFQCSPLLSKDAHQRPLSDLCSDLMNQYQIASEDLRSLEEKINQFFIHAYSLHDELEPVVSLADISLYCNAQYRYKGDNSNDQIERQQVLDLVKDLISYSVGCMFGRYSMDKPGLILAKSGETRKEFAMAIPNPTFSIDDDNVIPILDGDWFTDDIAERFRRFMRIAFGEKHYEKNLQFVETVLGKDLRKYFLKDFYSDHLKRYKKRPIYWLFSSPKGTFNALIYMHRYRTDTVSVVLNDYLREFRNKLAARKSHSESIRVSANASSAEKNKALKEVETLRKTIDELDTYEREILYPLATKKIALDLDDGVKVNYLKLGKALRTIPGLANEED